MSTTTAKDLIIVESPTKAKTISKFLSSAKASASGEKNQYIIESSFGHIRDLPKSNKKAIDIKNGFIPHYEISKGKEKVVAEIKKLSKKAHQVYLATDPDREGEAIAWHIKETCGLKDPKRIVFHEITENAIKEAIEHPREIDENLREAQEARRVLDRLVGYDLSGLIWKKVRYGLSAGRVQSPALRIIMEREREIRTFLPQSYWVLTGKFSVSSKTDTSSSKKDPEKEIILTCEKEPTDEKEVENILESGKNNAWHITEIKQSETKRSPRAPFTTSTLQQTASSRLGFSPSRTMIIAQKLYEQGLITYMRTDSMTISKEALPVIYKEIEKTFGKEYLQPRIYKTKSKSAQEAHEAIRPTNAGLKNAGSNIEQEKLYRLIWERTVSSQMTDARILKTKVSANITQNNIPNFSVIGSITTFPGWLAADKDAQGEEIQIPNISKEDHLKLLDINGQRKETEPPSRYTEAGLVKELEKREIGRPSTYASIIKTLHDRGYVTKEGKTLHPTATGEVVSTFLENNFSKYINDSFTADMENKLDEIAEGKIKYEKVLKDFYEPFSKDVKSKEKMEKITNLGEADEKYKCPICNGKMVIKLSKNGKFLSCANFPKCTGARKEDGSIMEGPKETGEKCPKCVTGNLIEREGRFGKFISCSNYPKCKFIKKSAEEEARAKTGVQCPVCKNGELVERRGRFGTFYSCSDYPKCKFIIKSRPTGNICPLCGSLMMEGTKTIPERCSNKTCINHNPHKK